MIYIACTTLLLIGILGLLAMFVLGLGHSGHDGSHVADSGHSGGGGHIGHVGDTGHGGGHTANASGGGHAANASDGGHAGHADDSAHGATHVGNGAGTHGQAVGSTLLGLLSPLVIFSFCIGAGATGLVLKTFNISPFVAVVAAPVGGIVFYQYVIKNVWNLVFKFASTPSSALAGAVASEAEVVSGFNSAGQGLVQLLIDGQIVRILATLEDSDRVDASTIAKGERLLVTSVNGPTNTCRVARF